MKRIEQSIYQPDHFFKVGDKVVEQDGRIKRASLRDARKGYQIFKVAKLTGKNEFRIEGFINE